MVHTRRHVFKGMLTAVQLTNFKCFKRIDLDLASVTVFIGPNGTGKSSVAQALMVLKQSLDTHRPPMLKVDGPLSLGKFEDILLFDARDKEITISISGRAMVEGAGVSFLYSARFDQIGLKWHKCQTVCEDADVLFKISQPELKLAATYDVDRNEWTINPPEIKLDGIKFTFRCSNRVGKAVEIESVSTGPPDRARVNEYRALLQDLLTSISRTIENIYFVPGIRGIDTTLSDFHNEEVREFISGGGISSDTKKLVSAFGYYPDITRHVGEILEKITQVKVRYKSVPGPKQTLETLRANYVGNIINDGLGTNQLLFPIAQVIRAPSQSLIIIEEPELHLHPRAQTDLVDALVGIARNEQKQLLLITHSEHILFRLLNQVAKGLLRPQEVMVYYFERENMLAQARKLEIDEKGRLKGGMAGFFEHDIEQVGEYIRAILNEKET
ncbi:MAG TPA: hypothetical protein EYP60_01900 [bacterium (Candidatus Stahlbacteria)]|nr:hypothetical protein [Candidatus Stahlbacteria bacterium]